MQQRITYITLGVRDLSRMKDFYETVFGWQTTPASVEGEVAFFQLNGCILALYGRQKLADDAQVPADGNGFNPVALAYNVHSEKEVDELIKELETKGATITKQPRKVYWGGYNAYLSDPEGNLWEIAYNPYLKLDERGDPMAK